MMKRLVTYKLFEAKEKPDPWKGWKQQITDLIFKEFGEYATDDSLRVWVEW